MTLPLFFPHPEYVPSLPRRRMRTLFELCAVAGVACRASGAWTNRPVGVGFDPQFPLGCIQAEPQRGAVRISVPEGYAASELLMARYALGAMAFALFDLVSRESIRGAGWISIAPPRGRPAAARAMSNRERQRLFRQRRRAGDFKV